MCVKIPLNLNEINVLPGVSPPARTALEDNTGNRFRAQLIDVDLSNVVGYLPLYTKQSLFLIVMKLKNGISNQI